MNGTSNVAIVKALLKCNNLESPSRPLPYACRGERNERWYRVL